MPNYQEVNSSTTQKKALMLLCRHSSSFPPPWNYLNEIVFFFFAIYLQVLLVLKKQTMIIIIWKFDREATCHPLSTMSAYRKKFIYLQIQTNLFCCVLFTFCQLKYFQFGLKDCCFFTVLWSVIILVSI